MNRLKLWRLQHQLTQVKAARLIGIGESTLALLEGGRMRPSTAQLERLRVHFVSEVEALFDGVRDRVDGTGVAPSAMQITK